MVNFYLLPTLRIVVEGEGRATEGDDDDEGPEVELQTKFYQRGEGPYYSWRNIFCESFWVDVKFGSQRKIHKGHGGYKKLC